MVEKRAAGRRVRYAVVGLGYISQVAVLPAFRNARGCELSALVSGDPAKLRKLGRRYGVDRLFDYERFADCLREVDAVYIALPNPMHSGFAIAAAEAGVHVLCEKPLAVTSEECVRMIAAAEAHGVRLMTAYRLHFERGNLTALKIVRSGRIGEPRFFHSSFSMQVRAGNIRLDDEDAGGGPTYDLGVYCLNAARHLFDAEPEEVFAWTANNGEPRFAESHEMISALLRFPQQRLASFTVSNGAADTSWFEVVGTKGSLRMSPAYGYSEPLAMEIVVQGKRSRRTYARRDQFAAELVAFADSVRRGIDPEPSGREGLADVRVVEALLESARAGRPVRLARYDPGAGPDPEQELRFPPLARPKLVRAAEPRRG